MRAPAPMTPIVVLATPLLLLPLAPPAWAECAAELADIPPRTTIISRDFFRTAGDAVTIRTKVRNTGEESCNVKVVFDVIGSGLTLVAGAGRSLGLSMSSLRSRAGKLLQKTQNFAGPGLTGSIPAGATETLRATFKLPDNAVPKPGIYIRLLRLTLFDADVSGGRIIDSALTIVRALVFPSVDINISGTRGQSGQSGSYHLMKISQTSGRQNTNAYLQVRANVDYRLEITSQNQGHFARQTAGGAGARALLPYQLKVADRVVDLRGRSDLNFKGPTTIRGNSVELSVTFNRRDAAAAGTYRDILGFTVTALR